MTVFTIPRGQARALLASLLPHAGKQSDDTPDYGRIRFAPAGAELLAWTIDGATAVAAYVDVIDHADAGLDLFDLPTGAAKAALAVFRGPSDKDARQMWNDQPLRVTLTEDAVVLEEVDDILDGRALTVERWVTQGEDRYPDVARILASAPAGPDPNATALVSADAIARFIPSAKAWDDQLLLTVTTDPHRLEVRVGSRLVGVCPARRRDGDDRTQTATWSRDWTARLTPHIRTERPVEVDEAVQGLRDAMKAAGGVVIDINGKRLDVAADALTDDPDADDVDEDDGGAR